MIPRYFGLDTHKQFVMVAAVDAQQHLLQAPMRIDTDHLPQWAAQTLTAQDDVVLEVTTNTWHLYDLLNQYAGRVVVANPYKTKLIAEAHIKSDKVDALVLARLLAARFIADIWVPDHAIRQQRQLAAHRASLTQQSTCIKNRLHALLNRHNLRCPHQDLFTRAGRDWLEQLTLSPVDALQLRHGLRQLDVLNDTIHESQRLIAQQACGDARIPRLLEITGIGVFAAYSILAQIGDIARFPSPKKLTAFAGLVPSLHQSGQRSFNGHITKAGSPMLRWLMVEAARTAIRFDPHWQVLHQRLKQRRGSSVATVAIARKLLVVVWHLLHDQTHYHYLREQTFITKLQEWARKIGRDHLPQGKSRPFVEHHLLALGLHQLAENLISDKKGKLLVQNRNAHQT
jgi:transposase